MSIFLPLLLLFGEVPEGLSFTPWFTKRGVSVEIARPSSGPPWLRGTAELPVSASAVVQVVSDFPRYKEIFSPVIKSLVVLEAGERQARLHVVWPYPFPLRNRDAVIAYRLSALHDGSFRLAWHDDAKEGDPRAGVRLARVAGETQIVPLGPERARVVYTYLGDLGGKFPRSAEEKAWRAEPVEYFRALRRRLHLPDLSP